MVNISLYFSRKVTQSLYKHYFCVEFLDGGKWRQHFPVLFYGKIAQLINGDTSFQTRGQSFSSSTVWKSRSCCTRGLKRQQARDMRL